MSWRVAESLDKLLEQINTAYPNRSKVSDGSIGNASHAARQSDHNPDSHGVVHARDFTHDPAHGFDSYKFADDLLHSQDARLKYVISNGRIGGGPGYHSPVSSYNPDGIKPNVWGRYNGPNKHTHHVHVSVKYDTKLQDNTSDWKCLGKVVDVDKVKNPVTGEMWPAESALWSIWTYVMQARNAAGRAVALGEANSKAIAEVGKQSGLDPAEINKLIADSMEASLKGKQWTLSVDDADGTDPKQ